jgi:hypothetical protein
MQQDAARASTRDADATKKLARDKEKENLIREICILQTRKESIEELIDERKARLELLMAQDGERDRIQSEGEASFTQRRVVEVVSPEECVKRFSKQVLAEHFKPGVAFIEACDKEKVGYDGALIVGSTPSFKVERARTKAAKEFQKKLIEETKKQAEETLVKIQKSLREQKGD